MPSAAATSCPDSAVFSSPRRTSGRDRITGGKSVSYTITRSPGRAGRYLTASWALPPTSSVTNCPQTAPQARCVRAYGPVVGVDLNDGHLAVRRLDAHGNPVGRAGSASTSTSSGRSARGGTLGSVTRSPG